MLRTCALLMVSLALVGCGAPGGERTGDDDMPIVADIDERRRQFVPVSLDADLTALPAGDREALDHLVSAAEALDRIFFRQVWAGNPAFAERVQALTGPGSDAAREYYRIMYGPWDRLEDFEPFIGTIDHPEGAGFYPQGFTREEMQAWLESHPEDEEAFTSLHTVIRREGDGLVAVPYSEAYAGLLETAAAELEAAAAATDNESLQRFLKLRAKAFRTDDYFESDLAWMDLDSMLEVVIGPYEVYEDGLFGYKAAFETFLCVAQPEDSQRLQVFKGELPFLERNLPIPDAHKNLDRGTESPIRVVDEILALGDARAGVQTLAFNLPNDERVREAKGSKKVLLKNMMRAKYDGILTPIAGLVLPEQEVDRIDFDTYFHFILFHEMAHGLGPGRITVDGRDTEVRLELKDLYAAIEEAKADVVGAYNLYALTEKGVLDHTVIEHLPWTYTAGLFRSARFGTHEAHGLGVVIQANFLLDEGAIEVTDGGRFRPVPDRFPKAFERLAQQLLMTEATGDYDRAEKLVDDYGHVHPAMAALLESLDEVPVDVDPVFEVEQNR